jgi:FkbM family methyltransferase
MIRNTIYRLIYHPSLNPTLIGAYKGVKSLLNLKNEIPPAGVFNFGLEGGEAIKLATNQTCWVTKYIFYQGIPSFEYSAIFTDLIKRVNVFFDIGANIGYYSFIAAKLNPSIRVHAFEPAGGPLHYLRKNVTLNNAANIISVYDIALSDSNGELTFFEQRNPKYPYLEHNLGGMSGEIPDRGKDKFKPYQVGTMTLDHFTAEMDIRGIDLMKIDTEGTEDKILSKASATIERDRPIIICETLFNKIEDKLEGIMKDHDYLFFNFVDGKLKETDTIRRLADNGIRDCFFVPPEKKELIDNYL